MIKPIILILLVYSVQATLPYVCMEPNKEIYSQLKTRYTFSNGSCTKVYFYEFITSPTYFDTESECLNKCVNKV